MVDRLPVPAAAFGSDPFWTRLNQLADAAGHQDHPRWLSGQADPDNVYGLWCQRCDVAVVELVVEREAPAV